MYCKQVNFETSRELVEKEDYFCVTTALVIRIAELVDTNEDNSSFVSYTIKH